MSKNDGGPLPLRMSAYYYAFDKTGVLEIDCILSAVAQAGKWFHNTSDWNETAFPDGPTPIEFIQDAANKAADAFIAEREREE